MDTQVKKAQEGILYLKILLLKIEDLKKADNIIGGWACEQRQARIYRGKRRRAIENEIEHVLQKLSNIGVPAIKPLLNAINNDAMISPFALDALGNILDKEAVNQLIDLIRDENPSIRSMAIKALGNIGNRKAIKHLICALSDEDENVRSETTKSLENLRWKPKVARDKAFYWIEKGKWDKCKKLGKSAVEPLLFYLDYESGYKKMKSAQLLGEIRDYQAIDSLISALQDNDLEVRISVCNALDKLKWKPTNNRNGAFYWIIKKEWEKCKMLGDKSIEPLIMTLKEKDPERWREAIKIISLIGDDRVVKPLIDALDDELTHNEAILAINKLGDMVVIPFIKKLYNPDFYERSNAANTLAKMGSVSVPPLIEVLNDENRDARKAAAWALLKIKDRRSIVSLKKALNDEDEDVRRYAKWALEKIK